MRYTEQSLETIDLDLRPGDTVFLSGDLGAGKTTLVRSIIRKTLGHDQIVRSPTYTYFSFFEPNLYHFDLYRIDDYETFVNIGAEEIFDDPNAIRLVEWPEIIADRHSPAVRVRIEKIPDSPEEREITVERT